MLSPQSHLSVDEVLEILRGETDADRTLVARQHDGSALHLVDEFSEVGLSVCGGHSGFSHSWRIRYKHMDCNQYPENGKSIHAGFHLSLRLQPSRKLGNLRHDLPYAIF